MSTPDSGIETAGQAGGVPSSRDQLLARVGSPQNAIYELVRQILDDLEQAAPWDDLYYPPADTEEFLRKATLLLAVIEAIPQRVTSQIEEIEASGIDEATDELLGDMSFFFNGIHMSVEQEIRKLQALLERFQDDLGKREPSPEDRDFTCELSADLKGKYSSSIMGAAASLIAGGQWRGVEIEPVLFPEKAKEFERNERLVETLSEVTENIHNLLEQVPLAHLVEKWASEQRVDQYALTPLYSLLGNLGKLMQETSRRALYSGDYHQIQRREGLLASRVNELATLHNMTWGTVPRPPDQTETQLFAKMVRSATELAAVLHIDILKKIIGGGPVETLLQVVMVEKELNSAVDRWRRGQEIQPHPDRFKVPEERHSLIVLLYDEDLHTFLELLLGSVLKRASLTVKKEMEQLAAAASHRESNLLDSIQVVQPEELQATYGTAPGGPSPASASFAGPASLREQPASEWNDLPESEEPTRQVPVGREAWDSSTLDAELDSLSAPDMDELPNLGPPKVEDDLANRQQAMQSLGDLERLLDVLTAPSTPSLRSFQLIQRLLRQKRTIPPAMLQSMQPYLRELENDLLPLLTSGPLASRFSSFAAGLAQDCQLLGRPQLSPELLAGPVPEAMDRIASQLAELRNKVAEAMEEMSGY